MRIALIRITGLMADPNGPANGMTERDEHFRAQQAAIGNEVEIFPHAWDEKRSDDLCRTLLSQIGGGDFEVVIIDAHSFGGGAAMRFCRWLADEHPSLVNPVTLLINRDPVPNAMQFDGEFIRKPEAYLDNEMRWRAPAAKHTLTFFQRNGTVAGIPLGITGVPVFETSDVSATAAAIDSWARAWPRVPVPALDPLPEVLNIDMTTWPTDNGSPIGHLSIITDPRAQILTNIFQAVLVSSPSPAPAGQPAPVNGDRQ